MPIVVTVETFLFIALIVGLVVGFIGYRIYAAKRRIRSWNRGVGPGHESFIEIPFNRDDVFTVCQEILPHDHQIVRIARVERLILATKESGRRIDRITVRCNPTLAGCELQYVKLGPGWKSLPAGTNSPDAERFFNQVTSHIAQRARPVDMPGGLV